jgi:hypothetical protein
MSIRLDPRRVNTLKHLAGEAGVRPGDLVRQWVEERLDASRPGAEAAATGPSVLARLEELAARVAALETASGPAAPAASARAEEATTAEASPAAASEPRPRGRPRRTASAAPSGPRVALHDEMIAIIRERGPLPAGELADAITERGRYVPPRSGKPLDSATVSQRVSNPTYRSRFKRSDGRIGLADADSE